MRILLIDDETDFLELMKNRLEKRGFSVICADSGEKGLELIEKEEVDVAVVDVKMPGMDGLATLEALRRVVEDLPVLVLSGHADTQTAMSCIERGAADYLLKPVSINDLIGSLRSLVEKNI